MTSRTLSGTSTMQEILDSYPAAQRALFRKYHIGGCSSCGFQPSDLLQNVLSSHGCPDPIDSVITFIEESQALDDKTKVQPAQLTKWQQSKTALRLVDMRHPMEAAAGVIPGAVQLTQDLARELQEEWPKNTKIVLYCQHGNRSADAAAYLAGHGFTDVWSLAGGVEGWAHAGLPVVRQ